MMAAFEEDVINRTLDWVEETAPDLEGKVAFALPSPIYEADLPAAGLSHLRTILADDFVATGAAEIERDTDQATLREELALMQLDFQLDIYTDSSIQQNRIVSSFLQALIGNPLVETADGRQMRLFFQEAPSMPTADYQRRIIDFAVQIPLTKDQAYYLVKVGRATAGDSNRTSSTSVN